MPIEKSRSIRITVTNPKQAKSIQSALADAGIASSIVQVAPGGDLLEQIAWNLAQASNTKIPVTDLVCDREHKEILMLAFNEDALRRALESSEQSKTSERAKRAELIAPALDRIRAPVFIAVSHETTPTDVVRVLRASDSNNKE